MSGMGRKQNRKFYLSVEGDCEALYFQHLQKLINTCPHADFNAKIVAVRKIKPTSMLKRQGLDAVDKFQGKQVPFFHIQDIEDYHEAEGRRIFQGLIDDLADARKTFNVAYDLGYSNYTFELWLLLHVTDMNAPLADRYHYLNYINRAFGTTYKSLSEYKKADNFCQILKDFITLEAVLKAIERSERLRDRRSKTDSLTEYRGIRFYADNPDTTVGKVVQYILRVCGIL